EGRRGGDRAAFHAREAPVHRLGDPTQRRGKHARVHRQPEPARTDAVFRGDTTTLPNWHWHHRGRCQDDRRYPHEARWRSLLSAWWADRDDLPRRPAIAPLRGTPP